ncbi:hypothetical protein GCM10027590_27760 [Nocardiopsis nanhaiensis]
MGTAPLRGENLGAAPCFRTHISHDLDGSRALWWLHSTASPCHIPVGAMDSHHHPHRRSWRGHRVRTIQPA